MLFRSYDSKGVSKLRLWSAESMSFDMNMFNQGRDHPVLPNDPIHPINRRGRKNFCKEERKFKENPKSIYRMFELTSTIYCVRIAM